MFSDCTNERFQVFEADDYTAESTSEIKRIILESEVSIIVMDLVEAEYRKLEWLRNECPGISIITLTLFLFNLENRYEHLSFFPDLSTRIEEMKSSKYGNFKIYAGPDYFLFRDEFEGLEKTIRKDLRNILISMGGSDPKDITLKAVHALHNFNDLKVKVILSEVSHCYKAVKKITDNAEHFELIRRTDSMAGLMLESDLAIINGGATRYEMCLAKTPFIAISIHKTQFGITKNLTDLGVGINLGVYKDLEPEDIAAAVEDLVNDYPLRKQMSHRMTELFDTNGAQRIYQKIEGFLRWKR